MKVDVYWNLHKHMWSVRDRATGRVVKHTPYVRLKDATFVVQKAGQRKVRETGRKNVHAFVRGELVDTAFQATGSVALITYNPYVNDTFVRTWPEAQPVHAADWVSMDGRDGAFVMAYNPTTL